MIFVFGLPVRGRLSDSGLTDIHAFRSVRPGSTRKGRLKIESKKYPHCEVCGGLHGIHPRGISRPRKSIEYLTKKVETKGLLGQVNDDDKSIDKTRTDGNKVSWDEDDPNFYENKKAIAEAVKVGHEHEINELVNLDNDYGKLRKLLRKPACTIKYMSVKSPRPRGRVDKIGWRKYLKNQIKQALKTEEAAEQKVRERMQ